MLATIRRVAKTWPARALFVGLVGAFGLWGVAGRLTGAGGDTAVARVGGSRIELAAAQHAYALQMAQLAKRNGADWTPPPAVRTQVARSVIGQLVQQTALSNELARLGAVVPDAAVRDTTFGLGAFAGTNGKFDRTTFLSVLARNNLDEAGFIALVRSDLARQQLIGAVQAGVAAPAAMLDAIFAYARETRVASAVSLPIAAAAVPAAPSEAQLRRFWANNPGRYATPEYRKIRAVVLSPQTLAADMTVSEAQIAAYYAQSRAVFDTPERRSVQILSSPDAAVVGRLAAAWSGGADWAAMQAQSKAAGASALELADARQSELPDAALGRAAFGLAAQNVSAPIHGDFGWYVARVTKVTAASLTTLAQARGEIRARLGVLAANEVLDDRANKVEDALAGGGGLETLPQGLGLAAVQGTLDARGDTPEGAPAPLPAFPALRTAMIEAAFAAKVGAPAHLEQLASSKDNPGGAYYAVTVESIGRPAQLGFAQAQGKVREDWTQAQMRHAQETAAAALLTATQAGTPLVSAALARGLAAQTLPPVPRPLVDEPPPAGVPPALVAPLFGMVPPQATMVETADGFMVAQLQQVRDAAPASDPIGTAQLRTTLTQSIAGDAADVFVQALQQRDRVTINQAVVAQIAPP